MYQEGVESIDRVDFKDVVVYGESLKEEDAFNKVANTDLTTTDDQLKKNVVVLGKSWIVPGDTKYQ